MSEDTRFSELASSLALSTSGTAMMSKHLLDAVVKTARGDKGALEQARYVDDHELQGGIDLAARRQQVKHELSSVPPDQRAAKH